MKNSNDLEQARALIRRAERGAQRVADAGRLEWPEHARALCLYLTHGIRPGGALAALIDGDMWAFIAAADANTWKHARSIARTLYSEAPRQAIGSSGTATIEGACADWCDAITEARAIVTAAEAQSAQPWDPAVAATLYHIDLPSRPIRFDNH